MFLKKRSSAVKTKYFLFGLVVGAFIIPKLNDSTVGSHNGNTYYFITKKED